MQVWRLPDLVQTLTLKGHRRGVWSAAFSPVDQAVLTGSGDATVRLWALTDGSCLKTFEGHSASVLRASFISYGTQVCTCRGGQHTASLNRRQTQTLPDFGVGNTVELQATGQSAMLCHP